jgi:hypothetical protein
VDQLDVILRGWHAEIRIEQCTTCHRGFSNCRRCNAAAELAAAGATVLAAAIKEAKGDE